MIEKTNHEPIVVTKKSLAQRYGLPSAQMRYYLNVHFFDELEAVGYSQSMRILPPIVVRRFTQLFGEPINEKEL